MALLALARGEPLEPPEPLVAETRIDERRPLSSR
jgi:hypothetical protein